MRIWNKDFINQVICGDALTELKKFPDESIDSTITSPPYFNLRDYGVKGQIGLEKTHQEYIAKLIEIFNEVKRVLKKDGTCFVNLGDSYGGSGMGISYAGKTCGKNSILRGKLDKFPSVGHTRGKLDKSLLMIPERFAIEMINQGWILRNKLVWVKPNAMPESVRDRWKKAHEYIFFFTKSKKYYFDLDAIRTPHKEVSVKRAEYEQVRNALGLNPSSMGKKYKDNNRYMGMPARMVKLNEKGACPPDYFLVNTNCSEGDGSDEHYATYPQRLLWPLIKSGCPAGGIVLDHFMGSGTTAVVAKKLNRNYIGIEINSEYVKICNERLRQGVLL